MDNAPYDMPTVPELRLLARSVLSTLRTGATPLARIKAEHDLRFVNIELGILGADAVMAEELRRHELLSRGYLPPEDLSHG